MSLGRRRMAAISDINVTPIVDVMLMLLVIFILTAPVIRYGLDIGLPKGDFDEQKTRQAVIVSLRQDGQVFVQDKKVDLEQVPKVLTTELARMPASKVMIAADKRCSYEGVMELLSNVRSAGVENVYLLTESSKVFPKAR